MDLTNLHVFLEFLGATFGLVSVLPDLLLRRPRRPGSRRRLPRVHGPSSTTIGDNATATLGLAGRDERS